MTKKEDSAAGKKLADPAPGSDYFVSEILKNGCLLFSFYLNIYSEVLLFIE